MVWTTASIHISTDDLVVQAQVLLDSGCGQYVSVVARSPTRKVMGDNTVYRFLHAFLFNSLLFGLVNKHLSLWPN